MSRKIRDEKVFEEYLTERIGEAVTLIDHIREVLCSNLGRDTEYPNCGLSLFPHLLQANVQLGHRSSLHPFEAIYGY
jgi:hypothetical protein